MTPTKETKVYKLIEQIPKLNQLLGNLNNHKTIFAQSAGAVEYTDCFSAEG